MWSAKLSAEPCSLTPGSLDAGPHAKIPRREGCGSRLIMRLFRRTDCTESGPRRSFQLPPARQECRASGCLPAQGRGERKAESRKLKWLNAQREALCCLLISRLPGCGSHAKTPRRKGGGSRLAMRLFRRADRTESGPCRSLQLPPARQECRASVRLPAQGRGERKAES